MSCIVQGRIIVRQPRWLRVHAGADEAESEQAILFPTPTIKEHYNTWLVRLLIVEQGESPFKGPMVRQYATIPDRDQYVVVMPTLGDQQTIWGIVLSDLSKQLTLDALDPKYGPDYGHLVVRYATKVRLLAETRVYDKDFRILYETEKQARNGPRKPSKPAAEAASSEAYSSSEDEEPPFRQPRKPGAGGDSESTLSD